MTPLFAAIGLLVGFCAGVLSGMFGVGGGIVMTPAIQLLLAAPPIVALATPLPIIFPTALMGSLTYRRAGQVDDHAVAWIIGPGIVGAVLGAAMTRVIDTHLLLVVTAALMAYQAVSMLRGATRGGSQGGQDAPRAATPLFFAGIGFLAGAVSGLLGIGGGLIMVPLLAGWLGMPLKTALGTSLLAMVAFVIPGTLVHSWLGHIDWAIFLVVTAGSVPGAFVGARIALRTKDQTLRIVVGTFLLVVAVGYGASEVAHLLRG
jgi:uncharacterized membrane protein YfcA